MSHFWVFGYGSLMWRPGFSYIKQRSARLHGAHRQLCIYSHVHRGTRERPGLVLGLDSGGSCRGIAFQIDQANKKKTLDYLRTRELVTMIYHEVVRKVTLDDGVCVDALTYIVNKNHPQYAGRLDVETQFLHTHRSHGQSGANKDYILNTHNHLIKLGVKDKTLKILADRLGELKHS